MLTDSALRNLKPKSKIYKVSDRDGMYVTVSTSGTVSFRYDYRLNGRRETLTLGQMCIRDRAGADTASTRTLPSLLCGSAAATVSTENGIWPPIRSVMAGALPL